MVVVFDVGNTNLAIGIYNKGVLTCCEHMLTPYSYDDCFLSIKKMLLNNNISEKKITDAVISSVVPCVTPILKKVIYDIFSAKILTVNTDIDMGFSLDDTLSPDEFGADLIAGCAAGVEKFSAPLIIFDIGTATTAVAIDKEKKFYTCLIFPGPTISLKSLFSNCSLLPDVNLNDNADIIANNTIDCIRSGVVFSFASIIDGLSSFIEEKLGYKCNVIVTGGLSHLIIDKCKREVNYEPNLLLDGLYILHKKNS